MRVYGCKGMTFSCFLTYAIHDGYLRNGKHQVINLPQKFALSSTEVSLHKEGQRLIIESICPDSLLAMLSTLADVAGKFPDVDEELLPLDT